MATPYAALLWWRTRAPLQHLAMFAGAATVVGAGIASVAPGLDAWAPGARGVLQVVPQTASRYLPQSVAAPLAVFCVGVALLGVALWLARARRAPKAR